MDKGVSLPADVVECVLARLPVRDAVRLGRVACEWRRAARWDTQRRMHLHLAYIEATCVRVTTEHAMQLFLHKYERSMAQTPPAVWYRCSACDRVTADLGGCAFCVKKVQGLPRPSAWT